MKKNVIGLLVLSSEHYVFNVLSEVDHAKV